jgi:hypothetical protein
MAMWFKRESYCPAGCNCECIFHDEPPTALRNQKNFPHAHEPNSSSPPTGDRDTNDTTNYEHTSEASVTSNNTYSHDSEQEGTDYSHEISEQVSVTSHELTVGGDEAVVFDSEPDHVHDSPDLLDAPLTFDDDLPSHFFPDQSSRLFSDDHRSSPAPNVTNEFF